MEAPARFLVGPVHPGQEAIPLGHVEGPLEIPDVEGGDVDIERPRRVVEDLPSRGEAGFRLARLQHVPDACLEAHSVLGR